MSETDGKTPEPGELTLHADAAARFLKGLANPQRLMILCRLIEGEMNVGELVAATGISQTSMSQHLARLKEEGIVSARREHRVLFYRISHDGASAIMDLLHRTFCEVPPVEASGGQPRPR
ncbi:ArsR/SmtB family transcription factor [Roseibium aestuarii]|uniref:ArsR/SmtB family transcription factor n=1 Tax=Roseibium aestuarii TaxID=2600299 RepID=A0ABW4JXM6_9HYPH|nr:metalloregulator ArsR/SmtB family transcription factor [Roseibium aestuarii]